MKEAESIFLFCFGVLGQRKGFCGDDAGFPFLYSTNPMVLQILAVVLGTPVVWSSRGRIRAALYFTLFSIWQ
jgi:hypothetical protein